MKHLLLLLIFTSCTVLKTRDKKEILIATVISKPEYTMKGYHFKVCLQAKTIYGTNGECYWYTIPHDTVDTYINNRKGKAYEVGRDYTFSY